MAPWRVSGSVCAVVLCCSACSGLVGETTEHPMPFDAAVEDAGHDPVPDAGPFDAGVVPDAGPFDAGVIDSGVLDAGPVDAGFDAGSDPLDQPGIFAGAGNHVRHMRSLDDGLTWVDDATEFSQSMTGDLYGVRSVAWGNGTFVAFAAKVLTSNDGKTWTEVDKPDGQWLASMLYAQGEWVSSGGYGWLATTVSDLGHWTQHPPQADYTAAHHSQHALAHGVVSGTDAYVVVDDLGNIFHSADGQTWLTTSGVAPVPAGNTWGTAFVFGNGVFVGLLPSGTGLIRSTDGGATWTNETDLPSTVGPIIFAQGHFTAVGSGHVYTSTDGETWTDHSESSARQMDLTYGHGTYLGLDNGTIYRSTDGLSWTKVFQDTSNPDPIAAIAFGPQ